MLLNLDQFLLAPQNETESFIKSLKTKSGRPQTCKFFMKIIAIFILLLSPLALASAGIVAICQTDKSQVLSQFVKESKLINQSLLVIRKSGYKDDGTFDKTIFKNRIESLNLPSSLEIQLLTNLTEHIIKDSSLFAVSLIKILQGRCQLLNREYSEELGDIPSEVYSSASYRTNKVLRIIPETSSNLVITLAYTTIILLVIGAGFLIFIGKDQTETISI